ncbi:MAG: hypothetical protein A3E83_00625 [Gammaproteobacteria bacterium RIFCSPHIGHO2_12_FULL_41_20]|nr:MAG: hypothetical protein A3E83_00625 [Gammaproteobacteria bacterium RIFCSPHIGHO2_12_FULL_41_20]
MRYKVTEQYVGGSDIPCAEFSKISDARLFVDNKLEADRRLKVRVTYRIYDGHTVLEEKNQDSLSTTSTQTSSMQTTSTSSSPSPFSTTPKPAGMPPSRWASVLKDEKEGKK